MARRTFHRVATVVACLTLQPAVVAAGQQAPTGAGVLPDFDIRVGREPAPSLSGPARAALDRLRARQPGRQIRARLHPLSGGVRSLATPGGAMTQPSIDAPETVARRFLAANYELFGLTANEVGGLIKVSERTGAGATHLQFDQVVDGIPVFNGRVDVHLDRRGSIVLVNCNAAPVANDPPEPRVTSADAVTAAAASLRPALRFAPQVLAAPEGVTQSATFAAGGFRRAIPAALVRFPMRGGARLAWRVVIEPMGFPQAYEILVDAASSQILYRRNLHHYTDGLGAIIQLDATSLLDPRRPDPHPLGSDLAGPLDPPRGCPPLINYLPRSLTLPFRDPGTVLADTGHLHGNNGHVFRGSDGVEGAAGVLSEGGWEFDYPFNTADSAETTAFFALNFAHDFFYDLGFDEAAGNFQVDNFGRGGLGGDEVIVNVRAAGRNNASFATPIEGESPTMNVFLWDGQGCWSSDVDGDGVADLDGAYDVDVIVHEYHHGVTHRLNTAFTGAEAGAMGEGGGDFFAYSVNGDTRLAEYSSPPDGLRGINAKTYADWFCFLGLICLPHNNGQIWANALWDVRERFRTDMVGGGEPSGIDAAHQLYIDALKLSPANPTMLEMRDAMLVADLLRNPDAEGGGLNACRLWESFAGRGMGINALDTKDTGTNAVVADFTVPDGCAPGPGLPTLTVQATAPSASEAGTVAGAFTVTRTSGDTDLTVPVVVAGTATPGTDYTTLPATVTIPAGSPTATVTVTPVDDLEVEDDETVTLQLMAGAGYAIGVPASATVTIVSDDVASDLRVTALSAPSVAAAGASVAIAETTANLGAGDASPSVTAYYLSTNVTLGEDDVRVGERAVPSLAAGTSSGAPATVSIPADVDAGTYFLLAVADAEEALAEVNELNNTKFSLLWVGPDLVVSALDAPSASGPGGSFAVGETTKNLGSDPAPLTTTRFYLSSNPSLDAADVLLGSRGVAPLDAGAANTGSTQVTIPGGTATGTYYLIARADDDDAVAETQEVNNTKFVAIEIGTDLVVSSLTVPAAAGPGLPFTVTETTENEGDGDAAQSATHFFLSEDVSLDSSDALVGARAVPALAGGAASSGATSLTVPTGTAAGTYFVIARADAEHTVVETNEANNTRAVSIRVGSDLTVSALNAPASAGPSVPFALTDTTSNQGGAASPPAATAFYLSADAIFDHGDARLASRGVPSLAIGESSTASTSVVIPAGTAAGTYYVIAVADAEEVVAESLETNNTRTRALRIGADLAVSALSAPLGVGPGVPFTATDTTKNQGAADAGSSVTRFFVSTNVALDGSDVELGARLVSGLAAGETSTASTILTLPAGLGPGSFFLLAVADADDVVTETQEGNNTKFVALQIGPDLVVPLVSAPATAGPGVPFSVTDTTRNAGAADAAGSVTRFYLSTDFALDPTDLSLGERAVPALLADQSSTMSTVVTVPMGTAAGTYYLLAQADADQVVTETNEVNNLRFATLRIGADLILASLAVAATGGAGLPLEVTDTTLNQGNAAAPASTTAFFLSSNLVLDGADVLLGGRLVPALGLGESSAMATTLTIPPATPAGAYYVIAGVDVDDVVPETLESNNTRTGSVRIGPDLTVSSVAGPFNVAAGAEVSLTSTLANVGGGAAAASSTRFYLSSNVSLDTTDVLLGATTFPALPPGATSTAVTLVTLPSGLAAGFYFIIAEADGDLGVPESQEANNTRAKVVRVVPGT